MVIEVDIKDTEVFKTLCKVIAFMLDKADQETKATATKQLVDAGIVDDPARLQ